MLTGCSGMARMVTPGCPAPAKSHRQPPFSLPSAFSFFHCVVPYLSLDIHIPGTQVAQAVGGPGSSRHAQIVLSVAVSWIVGCLTCHGTHAWSAWGGVSVAPLICVWPGFLPGMQEVPC